MFEVVGACLVLIIVTIIIYLTTRPRKPLLILNLSDVLVYSSDIYQFPTFNHIAMVLGVNRVAWMRPHLIPFLEKCHSKYTIAIWSSDYSSEPIINLLFGKDRSSLLFVWDRSHAKVASRDESIRKQLSHVWQQFPQYDASNTIMIDSTEDTMVENPVCTRRVIKPWLPIMQNDLELMKGPP